MAELVDEFDSAQQLAYNEAQKLLAANPKHELLKYFVMPDEDMTEDGKPDPVKHAAIQTELKDCFWDRQEPWREEQPMLVMAVVLFNYYHALKKVNEERSVTQEVT